MATHLIVPPMESLPRAARLTLLTALLAFLLGGSAVGLGSQEGSLALWAFGLACFLQIPTALGVRSRVLEGLGNRGLDRELRTLRAISHLERLFALGIALASGAALAASQQAPETTLPTLGLAAGSVTLLAPLWWAKQGQTEGHPTLTLEAARTRTLAELAVIFLVGSLLGRWLPWADATTGLVISLRLFFEGHALAKLTTLKVACGGCGGGGGCH